MHENRETSSLTAPLKGSPAGEGRCRTPGMHGDEESDRAILPMRPANKATGHETAAAELAEGRARTQERFRQQTTGRTQGRTSVSHALLWPRALLEGNNPDARHHPGKSRVRYVASAVMWRPAGKPFLCMVTFSLSAT
jgi:hypothetical protein